jgi:hypothetical protein
MVVLRTFPSAFFFVYSRFNSWARKDGHGDNRTVSPLLDNSVQMNGVGIEETLPAFLHSD